MNLFDTDRWNEIWETISRNKKRSIMTAMGVFWGIFMLTVMIGAGSGLKKLFRANLGDMATNTCFFFPDQTSIPYKGMPKGRWWQLDDGDIEAVRSQVEGVQYVAGCIWGNNVNGSYKERKGDYYLMGHSPDYQKINPQRIIYGRFINEIDMLQRRKVCVIGSQIWQDLFPGGEDPTGKTVQINNNYFTVIGVMKKMGNMQIFGDPETMFYVPFSLAQQMYGRGNRIDFMAMTGRDDADISLLEKEAKLAISHRHMISPEDTKAVGGFNMGEEFKKVSNLFTGISLLTWIVGLGTLLAGIVGVSNIMLVVVRERTQEIGVRRALGARPRTIIAQILSESFVLTFIAGVLGLAAAVGLLSLADNIIPNLTQNEATRSVSWQITFGIGMLSLIIIVAGSLLAGVIPANRALRIKAVDAIREE